MDNELRQRLRNMRFSCDCEQCENNLIEIRRILQEDEEE